MEARLSFMYGTHWHYMYLININCELTWKYFKEYSSNRASKILYTDKWIDGCHDRHTTVDSRYLEIEGTLKNSSRYPYFDISDL